MKYNKDIKQVAEQVFNQYEKSFRDLAPYDNEEFIETHRKESSFWKYIVPIFLVLAVGYIIIRLMF